MINPMRRFEAALRAVLTDCGIATADIDRAIAGELKEADIARVFAQAITAIGTGAAMKAALILRVAAIGGVYDPATTMWNLRPINIGALLLPSTEELGAICKFGGTPTFDAAKAITNLLRLIKTAGRL